MLQLDDLRDTLDPASGALRFSLSLATLNGITDSGWTLQLAYDSTPLDETVLDWNLSRPTGVAGLGWSLGIDRIEVEHGDPLGSDQALTAPRYALVLGQRRYALVPTGGAPDALTFAVEPHEFWRVRYSPSAERWTVTLEDGSVLTFGDEDSGRGSVDWGYAWDNWIGASLQATGRRRIAVGWSVSTLADVWGNAFAFTYEQSEGQLGGSAPATYTRDTRLTRVDGPDGSAIALRYVDKQTDEYQDPHAGAAAPAWQSRFATRALAAVDELAPGGAVLATTTFDYTGPGGQLATIGHGDRTKRLLTGIARKAPGGYELPGLSCGYDTDPTSPSYGALTSVITPAGGEAAIGYDRPALPLPKRDVALAPPTAPGVTYASPRPFVGDDYAVVLWHGSDGSVAARAYRWQGRWLASTVTAPPAADGPAYDALRVALGRGCFAIVGSDSYTLFHADPDMPGAWIGSGAPEPIDLPPGEAVELAAGRGYVALAGAASGGLTLRWFDGAAWQTLGFTAPSGTRLAAIDGSADVLMRISSTGGRDHQLLLAHLGPSGWTSSTFTLREWVSGLDELAVDAGASYAIVTLAGVSGGERTVVHDAVWWNAGFAGVEHVQLRQRTAAPAAPVQLRGATVLIDQDAYRFDGVSWRHQDLSTLVHPGQRSVIGLSAGTDQITRAVQLEDGSLVYDLLVYDPTAGGATPWGYAPGLSGVRAGSGATTAMAARFDHGEPGAASRFVLLNNALYLQAGDGSWSRTLAIDASFDADTIRSLQLFAERYVAHQTATGVTVQPLRGGGAEGAVELAGARLLPGAGAPMTGASAFVSYTGSWGDPAAALTLHRVVAEDVRGALAPLAVASIVLYGSGGMGGSDPLPYGAVRLAYDHGAPTATVSDDGRALEVNAAGASEGGTPSEPDRHGRTRTFIFNRLTAAEQPALPYPTGDEHTNAPTRIEHVVGLPYAVRALAADGGETLVETAWWWVAATATGGTYARVRKEATAADGVPSERTLTYAPETGLVTELRATLADDALLRTTYAYWWERYDPTRERNLLTPVVQCMQYAGATLVRGSVTTWTKDWSAGGVHWAPRGSYVATAADASSFDRWSGEPLPAPAGWRLTDLIADRSDTGAVQLTRDALGRSASTQCTRDGTRQLASFANADVGAQEAYHFNCEPYEDTGPWTYRGGTIGQHLVEHEAKLGSRCLEIAPDAIGASGPFAAFTPGSQERSYLFAFWVETGPGFAEAPGQAGFELTAHVGDQQIGSLTLLLPGTNGRWVHQSVVVPLAAWRAQHAVPPATQATIAIRGSNAKLGTQALLDGLRFQPVDATFFAEVPDPVSGLSLGSTGPNGITYKLLRDANRIVTATVGPDPAVARLAVPSFARLLTSDGRFASAFPNAMLESASSARAVHQDFEATDARQWTLPSGWTIGDGALRFTGSQPQPPGSRATLNGFAHAAYVAHVRFLPGGDASPDVGIGCGNLLALHLGAPDAWVLMSTVDGRAWTQGPAHPGPLGRGDVAFALLDGRVTLFAAGRQVFSELVPAGVTPDGTLNLYLSGPGSFTDLVALVDPELRLVMSDGRGQAQQSIDLRDAAQVTATGAVVDERGLPQWDKNPVAVALDLDGNRIAGAPTSYLPPIGGHAPTLEQYLRYGNGSPFVRTVPEQTPLARVHELGRPGDELAVGGGHSSAVAYSRNSADGPMGGLVPAAQAGNYELLDLADPDGKRAYRLVSSSGEPVAQRVELAQGSLTRGFARDPLGRLTGIAPPNAYSDPAHAAHWTTTYARDFLGQVVETASPDAGVQRTAYDALGRPRFEQSAADAAATPPRLRYRRFDGLDRVLEEGRIPDVAWEAALAHVDDPDWPTAATPHSVETTFAYDVAPAGFAATGTEGRQVERTSLAADGGLRTREVYGYDVAGNVVAQWTHAPAYGEQTWLAGYDYDSRGSLREIRYPKALEDGSAPLTVAYEHDREGRVVAVGEPPPGGFVDPLNPPPDRSDRYARFDYEPDGALRAAAFGNDDQGASALTVAHAYSPAGWPLSTRSAIYDDELTYTSGGYGGAGSYSGLPASAQRTWRQPDALYPRLEITERLAHDQAGRLIAAAPYLAPSQAGPAPPLALDANGNLLTVQRGDSSAAYRYPAPTGVDADDAVLPSDRLEDVVVTLASSCTFESQAPPGWSWGASDGGPGGAEVVEGGHGGGRCLQVHGGQLGMAGVLAYRGYVDPRGSYTLRYWLKASPAFAAQAGPAGWYLELHGPDGLIASRRAAAIVDPPTDWTEQTVSFDLASLYPVQGDYAQVVDVAFVLRNHRDGGEGALGAALQVDDLSLTGSGELGTLEYDASGRVTALAGAGLSALSYAEDSNTLAVFRSAARGGYTLDFALGDSGEYALREATPVDPDGVHGATLYLRAPDGRLLARMDRWGGQVNRRLYIEGPQGTFATEDDGRLCFLVRGSDGGVRAVADEQGELLQCYDDDAFGALQQCAANAPDPAGRLDPFGVLDLGAGAPYAPWLGRTLAPRTRACPPEPTGMPAPAEDYLAFLPQFARTLLNLAQMHLIDGPHYMSHNPSAWMVNGLLLQAAALATLRGRSHAERVLGLGISGTVLALPFLQGMARYVYMRRHQSDCRSRGMLDIKPPTLVEDIYHAQFYDPLESIGGKHLRLRSVEQIPDGFYIFVVNEWDEFLYRDMSDRAGGTELYVRHSMLASGGCARAAGMMAIFGEEIVLTNSSGHYNPELWQVTDRAVPLLRAAGYERYSITVCRWEEIDLKKLMIQFRKRTMPS
jgi:hypothetical protein